MLVLVVDIQVKPDGVARFEPAMLEQAHRSLADEPGCHAFTVSRAEDDPCRFVLYEEYDDAAAFEAHMQAPHSKAFFAAVDGLLAEKSDRRYEKLAG